MPSVFRRFDDHGDPNGCWDWTGTQNGYGYGQVNKRKYGTAMAHRLFYERYVGPIPEGLEIDHLCDNRKCVNPEHLQAVTKAQNVRRGRNVGVMTMEKANELRALHAKEPTVYTHAVLAEEFGISRGHAQKIWLNKRWADRALPRRCRG